MPFFLLRLALRSAFGVYGYMNVFAPPWTYDLLMTLTSVLALTAVFAIAQGRVLLGSAELPRRSVCAIYLAAILAAVAALVVFSGWERTASKWGVMTSQINEDNPRWQALQASAQILPDAGAFGLGPGTFAAAFPHYTGPMGDAIAAMQRNKRARGNLATGDGASASGTSSRPSNRRRACTS